MDKAALRSAIIQISNAASVALAAIDAPDTTVGTTPPTTGGGTTGTNPNRIEIFPGVFAIPDPDPTRGSTLEGQDMTKWPRFMHVDQGCNVTAWGPINRKWKASGWWNVFGTGKNAILDGSNGHDAKPVQPDYTAAGFPITYTLDPNTKAVIGTGTVGHDGHGFSNDAEVLAYIAAQEAAAAATPTPTPVTALADTYPNKTALLAACENFTYGVLLDGASVHDGFGPPDEYVTKGDGTVAKGHYTKPPETAPVRGADGLLDSYPNIGALVADAQAIKYAFAIRVDGLGIYPGFGPIVEYSTKGVTITR